MKVFCYNPLKINCPRATSSRRPWDTGNGREGREATRKYSDSCCPQAQCIDQSGAFIRRVDQWEARPSVYQGVSQLTMLEPCDARETLRLWVTFYLSTFTELAFPPRLVKHDGQKLSTYFSEEIESWWYRLPASDKARPCQATTFTSPHFCCALE